MAKDTLFRVSFADPGGTAVTVQSVTLEIGTSLTAINAAPFEFTLKAAGVGELTFVHTGHFTYRFKVEVVDAGIDFTVQFHSSGVDKPKMGNLTKVAAVDPKTTAGTNLLSFTVQTPREVVLIAGFDYHGGTKYRAYPMTRMHDLAAASTTDDYTVFTVFEMETGERTQWVRGRGTEKMPGFFWTSGWCLMSKVVVGTVAPTPVSGGGDPGHGSISITHVYEYIQEIGRLRAGTMMELHIFSHSWVGGPIFFDTNESAPFQIGGARENERDPDDHDPRFWKDFNSTNMPATPLANFKAAFSANAFIKNGGCLAVTVYRNMINAARNASSVTASLGIAAADRTGGGTVFPDTRPGILDFLQNWAFKQNYMFKLSQVVGQPVWGGPPGLGSLILSSGGFLWQYIPEFELTVVKGVRVKGKAYYLPELHFLQKNIPTWTFSSDWYLSYQ